MVTGDADGDGFEFTSTVPQSLSNLVLPIFGEGTDLIQELPDDSWAALAQPNVGTTIDYRVGSGHTPVLFAGTEVVEFSPTEALGQTMEVVTRNMEEMQAASS